VLPPTFVSGGQAALTDLWEVYEREVSALEDTSGPASMAASLGPHGEEIVARLRLSRALLGRAITAGEWSPYLAHTHAFGERLAELGIAFSTWHAMLRGVHARVTTALVESYGATPERLIAALTAASALLEFWIAQVAEPYLEARQRDRSRLLVDSVRGYAIFMLDARGLVTSWNAGAELLFGYTAEEVIGRSYAMFFSPAEREAGRPQRALAVAEASGRDEDEGPRVRKDGSLFWGECALTAIRSAGVVIGFAKVVRDLTERRQAEAERRGFEERFRALARATSDAIVTADQRGVITYVNHATGTLFGWPPAELVGQPLTVLMPERMRDAHAAGMARYVATGEARMMGRVVEQPALRRDGSEIATEMSITTWSTGGELAFAAIIRDVTERQALARVLEERTRQLEVTNREVEAFSYSVAHDLRAPLRSVSGFTQILLEDFAPRLDKDAANYLTKIQGGVARMSALIDALLQLARLARSELEIKLVNVTALARTIAGQLAAAERDRVVDVQIDPALRAQADGRLVRTLLENLLGNAWKFTSRTPAARIEVGSSDRGTFFVRDNGAGFDMAQAGKLFAPFERLHTADEFPGTGVGLATVQRIVARHGGRIWVQAARGLGATFFFTLAPGD
jgi:PAS domain S-box-containing protein